MRTHTNDFKAEIAPLGRQIKGKIYHYFNYEIDTETSDKIITENDGYLILEGYNKDDKEELTNENIYSMKLIKNGELLQSLMKQFNFEAKYDLRIGDVVNPHFGLLVNGEYEFLDYGDYIIYSKQYNANNDTWDYVCYDLMLYSMIQYNGLNISYPITVKNYINAIANKMGVGFANINDAFTNSDELIYKDLFKDKNKTYRDILDKLAEITASNILINDNNELEVYYPKYAGEMADMSNSSIEITDGEKVELQRFELEGKTEQDGEPTPNNPIELVSVGYENLFNDNWLSNYYVTSSSGYTANTYLGTREYFEVKPNTTYTITSKIQLNRLFFVVYDSNKIVITQYVIADGKKITFKTGNNVKFFRLSFTKDNSVMNVVDYLNIIQLLKGSQDHSYIPYGKYGIEVRTQGKNYIYKTERIGNQIYFNGTSSYTNYIFDAGTYTISYNKNVSSNIRAYYRSETASGNVDLGVNTNITFTVNEKFNIWLYRNGMADGDVENIQLEKSNQPTTYEPYKSNTYLYTLDNPLRSIGDTKDLLYIKNGYLYVDRKIGNVVLNGSEYWTYTSTNTEGIVRMATTILRGITNITSSYCNYYISRTGVQTFTKNVGLSIATNGTIEIYDENYNTSSSVTNYKTWLATHNTEVQYELAEPYTEELGQVEMPSTYKDITYLNTTDELEPIMNVSYISEFEEIDEEYLKDVNVNFGEKFGQINKIVLRNTETKIEYVAQDDISIEKNKLTQINIIDNPITLNGNEDNICQNILNKLNGLYYSINDFTTTGLCYYDFLDIFFVKLKDTRYQCLLLNNEITITQGIEETIFADAKSNSQVEGGNYETNYLTNKDIQTKITQLNDTKVESKSVINSINDSKEKTVISTKKIMYIKDFTGTTDANGFLDIELNADFVVCSATASFNSNDYGFVIPYYDYNSGSPKWKLKIKDKNDVAVANTQIATTIYYFKKERND